MTTAHKPSKYAFLKGFPLVMQATRSECAYACVAMLAAHHGNHISLMELRKLLPPSSAGATLKTIQELASSVQLGFKAAKAELETLKTLGRPVILHWSFNHFVVLVEAKASHLVIADPAQGVRKVTYEEASRSFTGILVELTPQEDFELKTSRPTLTLRELMGKVHSLPSAVGTLGALALVLECVGLLLPLFGQLLTDHILVTRDSQLLLVALGAFVMVLGVRTFFSAARDWSIAVLSVSLRAQLKERVLRHLFRLPASFFDQRSASDVYQRFEALAQIEKTLTTTFLQATVDSLAAFIVLAVVFSYSTTVGFALAGCIALYAVIRLLNYARMTKAQRTTVLANAQLSSHVLESIRTMVPLKVSAQLPWRLRQWSTLSDRFINRSLEQTRLELTVKVMNSMVLGSAGLLVTYFAGRQVLQGELSLGALLAVMAYQGIAASRLTALIDAFAQFKLLGVHLERLADIVATDVDPLERLSNPDDSDDDEPLRIELRNVSFRYSAAAPWLLRNVSHVFEPGQRYCIAGRSGAGKSTLFKILLGILIPTEGEVLCNGVPIAEFGMARYRTRTGVVLQSDKLYAGSVQENVSYFAEDVSLERVHHALNLACVAEDVQAMPMQAHTLCEEDSSIFSGGQTQRLLLARALYRKPKLLLMDEATSNLDVRTEAKVVKNLVELACTQIFIAHRPEAISSATHVLSLESASLIEQKSS